LRKEFIKEVLPGESRKGVGGKAAWEGEEPKQGYDFRQNPNPTDPRERNFVTQIML